MKIIIKEEGQPIEVLNMTESTARGTGEALGTAYRLADGRAIYVPGKLGTEGNETDA